MQQRKFFPKKNFKNIVIGYNFKAVYFALKNNYPLILNGHSHRYFEFIDQIDDINQLILNPISLNEYKNNENYKRITYSEDFLLRQMLFIHSMNGNIICYPEELLNVSIDECNIRIARIRGKIEDFECDSIWIESPEKVVETDYFNAFYKIKNKKIIYDWFCIKPNKLEIDNIVFERDFPFRICSAYNEQNVAISKIKKKDLELFAASPKNLSFFIKNWLNEFYGEEFELEFLKRDIHVQYKLINNNLEKIKYIK